MFQHKITNAHHLFERYTSSLTFAYVGSKVPATQSTIMKMAALPRNIDSKYAACRFVVRDTIIFFIVGRTQQQV